MGNVAFERQTGKSIGEVFGKTTDEIAFEPPFDEMLNGHEDLLREGLPVFSELSFPGDGVATTFECREYPLLAGAQMDGVFGLCRDISPIITASSALQRQGDLLQAANDAALLLFSDEEDMDDVAWRVLAGIGIVTGAERVDVWRNHGSSEEGLLCTQVYAWSKNGKKSHFSPHSNTAVYSANLPGWEETLSSGRCVNTLTAYRPTPISRANPQHTNLVQVSKA